MNIIPLSELAQNIKIFRCRKNMTQTTLAKILKTNVMCVSKWERGEQLPSLRHYVNLVKLINSKDDVKNTWILEETECPNTLRIIERSGCCNEMLNPAIGEKHLTNDGDQACQQS